LLAADLRARPGIVSTDPAAARAAVAIILRASPASGLELLLILRAERAGDPWSGQVALPGGRRDASDATLQDTAIRETLEETGIDLNASGVILGSIDDLQPRTPTLPPIVVTPFVAAVSHDVAIEPSPEVADAFWVPWSTFANPDVVDESTVKVRGSEWHVSSYVIGQRIVWGMTERMLRQLAGRVRSLPGP
jgi:8-oxo-dGTP pyrophosphatase MutT (NUDIX family)